MPVKVFVHPDLNYTTLPLDQLNSMGDTSTWRTVPTDKQRLLSEHCTYLLKDTPLNITILLLPQDPTQSLKVAYKLESEIDTNNRQGLSGVAFAHLSSSGPAFLERIQQNSHVDAKWLAHQIAAAKDERSILFCSAYLYTEDYIEALVPCSVLEERKQVSQEEGNSGRYIELLNSLLPFPTSRALNVLIPWLRNQDKDINRRFNETYVLNSSIFTEVQSENILSDFGLFQRSFLFFFAKDYLEAVENSEWFVPMSFVPMSDVPGQFRRLPIHKIAMVQRMRYASNFLPGVLDSDQIYRQLEKNDRSIIVC